MNIINTKINKEKIKKIIDPNKKYIIFQTDTYDKMEYYDKMLKISFFIIGLGFGILITSLIFVM